jgi:hypothetical protein
MGFIIFPWMLDERQGSRCASELWARKHPPPGEAIRGSLGKSAVEQFQRTAQHL